MKLTWIGHSCFKIEKDGFAVLIDPYADGSVKGLKPVRESADLVLCSHEHGDHNARDLVELRENGSNPFTIETIQTYHDDAGGAKRGPNKIFLLDDGEYKLAHLGDLGCELPAEAMEKLKDLDVLLLPVGGFYTIDAAWAADLVRRLHPRTAIPMHYRSDEQGFGFLEIGTVEEFTEKLDRVEILPGSELEITGKPEERVVVLRPQNRSI